MFSKNMARAGDGAVFEFTDLHTEIVATKGDKMEPVCSWAYLFYFGGFWITAQQ